LLNEKRPQYIGKWKTTSILWQMEDDLNILANGRSLLFSIGTRPQFLNR
jgi:hypothetical protein